MDFAGNADTVILLRLSEPILSFNAATCPLSKSSLLCIVGPLTYPKIYAVKRTYLWGTQSLTGATFFEKRPRATYSGTHRKLGGSMTTASRLQWKSTNPNFSTKNTTGVSGDKVIGYLEELNVGRGSVTLWRSQIELQLHCRLKFESTSCQAATSFPTDGLHTPMWVGLEGVYIRTKLWFTRTSSSTRTTKRSTLKMSKICGWEPNANSTPVWNLSWFTLCSRVPLSKQRQTN